MTCSFAFASSCSRSSRGISERCFFMLSVSIVRVDGFFCSFFHFVSAPFDFDCVMKMSYGSNAKQLKPVESSYGEDSNSFESRSGFSYLIIVLTSHHSP